MTQAGAEMGLPADQARRLAVGTFAGAAELARASSEPLATLRERVTSKGGTTYAAVTSLEQRPGEGRVREGAACRLPARRRTRRRIRKVRLRRSVLGAYTAYPSTVPANSVNPTQWFRRKALKQPSRERSRIRV
jgi:hypothetical protein